MSNPVATLLAILLKAVISDMWIVDGDSPAPGLIRRPLSMNDEWLVASAIDDFMVLTRQIEGRIDPRRFPLAAHLSRTGGQGDGELILVVNAENHPDGVERLRFINAPVRDEEVAGGYIERWELVG